MPASPVGWCAARCHRRGSTGPPQTSPQVGRPACPSPCPPVCIDSSACIGGNAQHTLLVRASPHACTHAVMQQWQQQSVLDYWCRSVRDACIWTAVAFTPPPPPPLPPFAPPGMKGMDAMLPRTNSRVPCRAAGRRASASPGPPWRRRQRSGGGESCAAGRRVMPAAESLTRSNKGGHWRGSGTVPPAPCAASAIGTGAEHGTAHPHIVRSCACEPAPGRTHACGSTARCLQCCTAAHTLGVAPATVPPPLAVPPP